VKIERRSISNIEMKKAFSWRTSHAQAPPPRVSIYFAIIGESATGTAKRPNGFDPAPSLTPAFSISTVKGLLQMGRWKAEP
jgi:hypothetical protein